VSKDVLLQTRVPGSVAREVKRRAGLGGDSDAGWLRRLLIDTTSTKPHDEFLNLGHMFVRKSSIVTMTWIDPSGGTCAQGEKPWVLQVQFDNGGVTRLPTPLAQIVLDAFGLPNKNPFPKGSKPSGV
jgi:hypothetical protein